MGYIVGIVSPTLQNAEFGFNCDGVPDYVGKIIR